MKVSLKPIVQNLKTLTISLLLGLILASGITFATTIWKGTSWVISNEPVSAENIKSNFDYLYDRVTVLSGATGTDSDILADITCAEGQMVKYSGGAWQCADF